MYVLPDQLDEAHLLGSLCLMIQSIGLASSKHLSAPPSYISIDFYIWAVIGVTVAQVVHSKTPGLTLLVAATY